MAAAIITKGLSDLKKLFSQMHNIYYTKTPNLTLATLATFDFELPVTEGGVTFKSGEAQLTKTKLTTGEIWDVTSKAGDDDIAYQIASFAPELDFHIHKRRHYRHGNDGRRERCDIRRLRCQYRT
jgi:hypothetical protein